MHTRTRMTLTFLSLALIPLIVLGVLSVITVSLQRQAMDDHLQRVVDGIGSGTYLLDRDELAVTLNNAMDRYAQIVETVWLRFFILGVILLIVLVWLAVWQARRFSAPFEKIASSAAQTMQDLQTTYENIQPAPKLDEMSLVSHTLGAVETHVKNEYLDLKKQSDSQVEALKSLTDKLLEIAQIGRESAQILDVEILLNRAARHLSEKYGFSHVGFYLLDESGQYIVLKAVDQRPGSLQLLKENYRLKVGAEGIPGHVAATGEPYRTDDIAQDIHAFSNRELEFIGIEAAFPLHMRTGVMGVLDIRSTDPTQFPAENMALLQVFANQVATAVENVKLFEQTLEALDAERRAYGEITRLAWDEMIRSRPGWGYRSEEQGIQKVEGEWLPWMVQAAQKGQVVQWQARGFSIASVPIRIRDNTLGILDFRKSGEESTWTTEEITLIQTLTDQLGQALESARLYQNTQLRAERERILADITSKVRASTNVNVILQTAVKELAEALQVPKGAIQLRGPGISDLSGGGNRNV